MSLLYKSVLNSRRESLWPPSASHILFTRIVTEHASKFDELNETLELSPKVRITHWTVDTVGLFNSSFFLVLKNRYSGCGVSEIDILPNSKDRVILEIRMQKIVKLTSIQLFACVLKQLTNKCLFFLLMTALCSIILICIVNNESGPLSRWKPATLVNYWLPISSHPVYLACRMKIVNWIVCQVSPVLAMEIQK